MVLICTSTRISDVEHLFDIPVGHLCVFLWQTRFEILCLFANWIVSAFLLLRFAVS